jgi:hypothetical protein
MFDLMQYALIFYDFQLILAQMGAPPHGGFLSRSVCPRHSLKAPEDLASDARTPGRGEE